MASTFKTLLNDDVVSTRTLLHEAIPITGTIVSGTYVNAAGVDTNTKTFSHGMFMSVYDYPFLSSSANHIFDITYGHNNYVSSTSDWMTQNSKKWNIYNQMAQVLLGYDVSGNIKLFDSNGDPQSPGTYENSSDHRFKRMDQCFFLNFSRLLTKDEIKKGSFASTLYTGGRIKSGSVTSLFVTDNVAATPVTIGDYQAGTEFRTSPAGDYGLLYTSSATPNVSSSVGLLFYQAGVAVITSSIFVDEFGPFASASIYTSTPTTASVTDMGKSGSINQLADGLRMRIHNISFNNTIELNSSIYFCRVNHNEFNYSSNPTYVSGSKIRVKNNPTDLPVSYITTVGLYSADNELLAVAKLSEPLRKDPNTELTLRVRLDY